MRRQPRRRDAIHRELPLQIRVPRALMMHRQIPPRVRIRLRPQPLEEQRQLRPRRLVRARTSIRPRSTYINPPPDVELRQIARELVREHRVPTVRDERLARVLGPEPSAHALARSACALTKLMKCFPARAVREEVDERRVEDADAAFA